MQGISESRSAASDETARKPGSGASKESERRSPRASAASTWTESASGPSDPRGEQPGPASWRSERERERSRSPNRSARLRFEASSVRSCRCCLFRSAMGHPPAVPPTSIGPRPISKCWPRSERMPVPDGRANPLNGGEQAVTAGPRCEKPARSETPRSAEELSHVPLRYLSKKRRNRMKAPLPWGLVTRCWWSCGESSSPIPTQNLKSCCSQPRFSQFADVSPSSTIALLVLCSPIYNPADTFRRPPNSPARPVDPRSAAGDLDRPAAQRPLGASSPDRSSSVPRRSHEIDQPEARACPSTRKADRRREATRPTDHDGVRCGRRRSVVLHLTFVRTTQESLLTASTGSTLLARWSQ